MTQVNFRIEEDVKNNAEKALKDMGLTMSAAITMFLVKVGREKRIPQSEQRPAGQRHKRFAEL